MIPVALELSVILSCAAILAVYVGWGVARLALPEALTPFRAPLTPLIGFAILLWLGYLLTSLAVNLRWALPAILAGATIVNTLAWRGAGPPRPLAWLRAQPEALIAPALALLAGIWPLLSYGYLTAIGQGWDTESYLPLAQHLIDYPLPSIMNAPQNPLRDLVADPPAIGLTLGFSVFQGMVMLVSGGGALATFAPVMAFLRALGILAIYVWLRSSMGLGRAGALLAATFAALGSLFLWIGYFNFGMQLSAWPLLALSLTLGLAAVDDLARRRQAAWRAALLAAITLAAVPAAYYPALSIWGPLIIALGIARLAEVWRQPGPSPAALVGAAFVLALATLAAGALAIVDYFEGFSFRYSLIEPKIGPDRFIGIDEILGLTAFRLESGGAQPPAFLIVAAVIAASLLSIAALATGNAAQRQPAPNQNESPRLRWALALLATIAALLWLRFGRPYEYGFMKGAAYTAFVFWGAAALGIERLAARYQQPGAIVGAGATLLILASAGWSQALIITEHARGPAIFTRGIATFEPVAARIPRGSTIVVSGDESLTGPLDGLLATMFYGSEIWGRVPAAYASQSYWPEANAPQYVALAAREEPWPLRFGATELWRSDIVALYQMPQLNAFFAGRSEIHNPARVDKKSPADLAIWRRAGVNRVATAEQPLTIAAPPGGMLRLTLAALEPQEVTIRANAVATTLALAAGMQTIETAVGGPLQLSSSATLALIDAVALPEAAPLSATVAPAEEWIAWSATSERRDEQLNIAIQLANPGRHALRYEITIVEDTFESPRRLARLLAAAPLTGSWNLALDLRRGASEARIAGAPVPLIAAELGGEPPDGRFFGVLAIYSGEGIIAQAPLFTLMTSSGGIATFEPVALSIEAARAGSAGAPLPGHQIALLNDAALSAADLDLALRQAVLERRAPPPGIMPQTPFAAGDRLGIQLYWRGAPQRRELATMPMISLQIIDGANRKWAQWDGILGGDWRPATAWQPGEAVRQDVPLTLDPATPPGDYRLLLVIYDPATGQPLALDGQNVVALYAFQVR